MIPEGTDPADLGMTDDEIKRAAEAAQRSERADICPECEGKGVTIDPDSVGRAFAAVLNKGRGAGVEHLQCSACDGTGRRDVRVVDADLLARMAKIVANVEPDNFCNVAAAPNGALYDSDGEQVWEGEFVIGANPAVVWVEFTDAERAQIERWAQ